MRRNKSLWYLAALVLIFAVVGSFLGEFLSGWVPLLGRSQTIAFKIPINLALNVLNLEFLLSLGLKINLLSVVGMLLGVYVYYNR
ncbi:MAG: DUF4321 domain-containing protein [Thermoanaerobacteraceae bacterium]|nr:DUF4321 domain-containing protein [Thermoanaerobacteraceae bacterium]